MQTDKKYAFKSQGLKLFFDGFFVLGLVLLIPLLGHAVYNHPWWLLMLVPLTMILFYQCYAMYVTCQFIKYDSGKKVIIGTDRQTLTLTHKDNTVRIHSSDVDRVELHQRMPLDKFGNHSYMVICTMDNKGIVITNLTIPLLTRDEVMRAFLVNKIIFISQKPFNHINQKRFPI